MQLTGRPGAAPRNRRGAVPGGPCRGRADAAAPLGLRGAATSGVRLDRRRSHPAVLGAVAARPAPRRAAGSGAGGGPRDRARALAAGGGRSHPRPARLAALERRPRGLFVPARGRRAPRSDPAADRDRAAPRRRRDRVPSDRAVRGGARAGDGAPLPARVGPPARGARRPGHAARRLARDAQPAARQPPGDERAAGPVERSPVDGRARPVRLAARGRRRRPHRRGARRARRRQGAVRPDRRPLACPAPHRSRTRPALPGAPPTRPWRRRPRAGRLRARDRRGRRRARRGPARCSAGRPAPGWRAPLHVAPDAGGDAVRPVPVPGARSRLAPAARRSRRRRDPGRRHGPGQDGAGDRDARLRARGRRRRPDPRRLPDERRQAVGGGARAVRAVAPRPSPPRQPPSFRPRAGRRGARVRRRRHLLRHRCA